MEILVNGEVKELQAKSFDGVEWMEWTGNLLENYGALNNYSEEKGLYVLSTDEYKWWQEQIEKLNEIDHLENSLNEPQMEEYSELSFDEMDLGNDCDLRLKWLREKLKKKNSRLTCETVSFLKSS